MDCCNCNGHGTRQFAFWCVLNLLCYDMIWAGPGTACKVGKLMHGTRECKCITTKGSRILTTVAVNLMWLADCSWQD